MNCPDLSPADPPGKDNLAAANSPTTNLNPTMAISEKPKRKSHLPFPTWSILQSKNYRSAIMTRGNPSRQEDQKLSL